MDKKIVTGGRHTSGHESSASLVRKEGGWRANSSRGGERDIPSLSVITATYNASEKLPQLTQSMGEQTCKDIEWIVIDGASTDGTVKQLQDNNEIDYWISEPDSGIYDAWNKGVRLARGDYICFIGADDIWSTPDSIERLINANGDGADIVSARAAVVSDSGVIIRVFGDAWSRSAMEKRQIVAHPGMIIRASLFRDVGLFDPDYSIAGDYEWLLRLNIHIRAVFLPEVTVLMGCGGVSEKRLLRVLAETRRAQTKHVGTSWIIRDLNLALYSLRILLGKSFRFFFSRAR